MISAAVSEHVNRYVGRDKLCLISMIRLDIPVAVYTRSVNSHASFHLKSGELGERQ